MHVQKQEIKCYKQASTNTNTQSSKRAILPGVAPLDLEGLLSPPLLKAGNTELRKAFMVCSCVVPRSFNVVCLTGRRASKCQERFEQNTLEIRITVVCSARISREEIKTEKEEEGQKEAWEVLSRNCVVLPSSAEPDGRGGIYRVLVATKLSSCRPHVQLP